jgi:predicted AlkP superfamily phosphohydrolase/phosphomutase
MDNRTLRYFSIKLPFVEIRLNRDGIKETDEDYTKRIADIMGITEKQVAMVKEFIKLKETVLSFEENKNKKITLLSFPILPSIN